MLWCVIMSVVGFMSGSVMFSYFIPKWLFGVDVRDHSADANPGSTNAVRAVGLPVGLLCMALDVFKAAIPIYAAVRLGVSGLYLIPVIVAPSAGHAFSPLLGFRGGKAVSTMFGSMLGIAGISKSLVSVVLMMVLFRFVIVAAPDALKVILGMAGACVLIFFMEPLLSVRIAAAVIGLIVLYKNGKSLNSEPMSLTLLHHALVYEDRKIVFRRV